MHISSSPVFGVDVDGVLADLVLPLLQQVLERTGVRFVTDDIVRFDLAGILGPRCWAEAQQVLASPGFASNLPVLPGALDGVAALRARGRVVFVTAPFAPSPTWAYDRASWLEQHFQAAAADIVSLADKTLFRGDVLVDDSPAQLEAWTRSGRLAVRVDRPWNRSAPGALAKDWVDVVRIIRDSLGGAPARQDAAAD